MSFLNHALSRALGVRVVRNAKLTRLEQAKQDLESSTECRERNWTAAELSGTDISPGGVRDVDGFKMLLDPESLVDRALPMHGHGSASNWIISSRMLTSDPA